MPETGNHDRSQISFPQRKTSGPRHDAEAAEPPQRPVGRPRIAREQRRTVPVTVRFTPAEAARLEQRARAAGCSTAAQARRDMVRTRGRENASGAAEVAMAYRALAAEARRIGVNLNQAVRRLNAEAADPAAVEAVRAASVAVARLLAQDPEDLA